MLSTAGLDGWVVAGVTLVETTFSATTGAAVVLGDSLLAGVTTTGVSWDGTK